MACVGNTTEKYCTVVINDCYGGFTLSDEAEVYYKKLKGHDPEYGINCRFAFDPILAKVVDELGEKASAWASKLVVIYVLEEFINSVTVTEYDGLEKLMFNGSRYAFDKSKKIVNSELSSDEKIEQLKKLYSSKIVTYDEEYSDNIRNLL